jgi:polyhydroxyalkanoate synthesis regulator phasin
MTFEQMQALLAQVVQAQAQAQVEMAEMRASIAKLEQNLAKLEQNVTKLQENLARTEAIANSNARAILANTEADRLHRQASADLNAKLDRLADLVERYIIAAQIRQDAAEVRLESLEKRVSDLEKE